jgi:hypothetical protein
MVMHRYQSLGLYHGQAFVPTMGKAPSGLLREIEPVAILEPTQNALAATLSERLSTKPTAVREWYRGDSPLKSVVQLAARSRSWLGFARESLRFALIETDAFWEVSVGEGASPDDVELKRLPSSCLPGDLAAVVLEVAQRRPIWQKSPRGRRTRGADEAGASDGASQLIPGVLRTSLHRS